VETFGSRAFTFDGNVIINFTCLTPTKHVKIHGKDLELKEADICSHSNDTDCTKINTKSILYDELREIYTIGMNNSECVQGRNYTVSIKYVGQISDSLAGFYRSSYTDSSGNVN